MIKDNNKKTNNKITVLTPMLFALNCKYIEPSLSYEQYLLEVVNGSREFFAKYRKPTEFFWLQKEQSHGEDDIASSIYSMDFKLIVNQYMMNAKSKNKPEVDYSHQKYGFITVQEKPEQVQGSFNNILIDLWNLKKETLESEKQRDYISRLMKNLRKNKNLFLYYPYEFTSENDIAGETFEGVLTAFFRTIIEYRVSKQPERDTFLCIKSNQWFFIYEWSSGGFKYRDRVHEAVCPTYRDIKLYAVY